MIRLGLRLTLSGGRDAAVRLILIAAAVALGAGLLLVTMAGINAVNLQNDRYAWFQSGASSSSHGEAETWWNLTADDFGSQTIGRLDVAPAGPGAPVPPGIAHLPAPGEYYASPALAALLRTTPADQLADRFPGHLAGTIGNAALPAPDSLLIIIGRTAAQMSQDPGAYKVSAIDTTPPSGCGSDSSCQVNVGIDVNGIDLIFSVVALALLFPVLIFIATATRLSAARREQRFAAMRLVGATPRQVSVVAAIESSVAAIAGTLAGFGLFFVFRAPLASIPWTGASFFTSDVSLSLPDILLIGLGVPVASAAAALLALRRVRISPLGVTRRVTPKAPRAWRVLPLLAGVVELGYFAVFGPPGTTARQVDAYVPGFLLVMVGLLYAGPWLTMMGSRVMARCTSRPAALIAARRLGDNPRAGFRAISGLILAMFATSVAVATITTINDNRGASHFGPTAATTVMYQLEAGPSRVPATLVRNLRDIRGVTGVALAYVNPADAPNSATAGLMSCAQLDRVPALGRCAPGARVAQMVPGGIGWYEGPSGNQAQRVWPPAAVPAAVLARMPAEGIFIATDGTAAAIERAQTILGNAYPYDGQAPTLAVWGSDNTLTKWRQLADVVIFVSIPIAGCTLAASVAGGLTERKRPFSMLRLTGAPLRMLQRVVALESAVPLIAVAALSIAAGFGATALFLRAQLHYSLASPGLGYLGIVLAALVLALAIIAATFPLLARITGPETARNELGSRPHGRTYPSRGMTDMINLGLRLTMHGGREALVRLVLLVAAVGVGVGLLLVTIAGVNAVNNQDDHYAWISSGLAALTEGGPHGSAEPLWFSIQGSMFEGQAIGVVDVAGTGPASPVVRARNLRKDYGSGEGLVRAVDGIDLDVIRGETVAVMGPSGCGKSTLLHLLGGLDRPTAGELWLAGQRIDEMSERALAHLRRSDIGFVFQAFQLLPALAGALLGIPVGIALYGTVQTGESQAGLPLLWVLFLVLGMLAAVVALTAVPTTISTRQPIAQILQSETA